MEERRELRMFLKIVVYKERNTEKHPPPTWAVANTEQQGGYLGKLI